ncbi:MAG TPA: beta-N-acetylhexosaminidase [Steroidobacteraceae bacterium]|nr:beta-N-acetylhexosaminidase [Steroidobacteraceae bacterium]
MSLGPLMIDLVGTEVSAEERELLRHPLVGGVILFTRNYVDPPQLTALVAAIHAARSPPLIVAVDQEGGRVQRFRQGFARLPPARRIGHQFDLDARTGLALARSLGWLMAAELRAHGVDLSFAPCVDLDYGVNEAIGQRAFHPGAEAVAQLAGAWMHGMREAGMAATAKHFPGHGAVTADSHLALPVDRRPLVDLAPELTPYRRLIANGLPAVMVAHILFPAVDQAPASLSRVWIRDVLRGELGFQGVVFADDLSMKGAAAFGDILSRSRQALMAGCDMLPVCNHRPSVIELLDKLDCEPQPASSLRLVRLHGRSGAPGRAALAALPEWTQAQELLAKVSEAPELTLDAGGSPT